MSDELDELKVRVEQQAKIIVWLMEALTLAEQQAAEENRQHLRSLEAAALLLKDMDAK